MTAEDRELDAMRSCCATTEGSTHAINCARGAAPASVLRQYLTSETVRGLLSVGIPSEHSEVFAEENRLVDKISAGLQQRRGLKEVASDELLDIAVGDQPPRGLVRDISMWDALPYQEYLLRRLELRRQAALDDAGELPDIIKFEDASLWPCCQQRAVAGHAPWCVVFKAQRLERDRRAIAEGRARDSIVISADAMPLISGVDAARRQLAGLLGADVPNPLLDDITWVDERAIAAEIDAEEEPDPELERFVSRLGLIAWSVLLVPIAAFLAFRAGMWLAEHAGPRATIASQLGQDAVVILVIVLAVVRLGGLSGFDDTTHSPT